MEYIAELVALGIDSVILAVCLRQYFYYKNAISAVKVAEFHDIDRYLDAAVSRSPDGKLKYVAIRGIVKSLGKPLHSIKNNDVVGVVQKLSIKEHVVARSSAGFWADQEHTMQTACNTVPFALKNGFYKIEVADPLAADILDMDVVSDNFEPSIPTFSDHLWGFFTGLRRRGVQSTEEMLREGTVITGIGEITKSTDTHSLVLQPPSEGSPFYLTSMSVSSLVKKLEERRVTYRWFCLMFGAVGILIGGIVIRRYWKNKEEQRRADELRQALNASRKERRQRVRDKDLREDQLCVVCRTNPREIILLPCGHVCLCEDCSDDITSDCPLCRHSIIQKAAALTANDAINTLRMLLS